VLLISIEMAYVCNPLNHMVLSVAMLHPMAPAALVVNALKERQPPEPVKLVVLPKEVAHVE
jgi:hypothetical protein